MPIFPAQGGSKNTWGTELRSFFSPFFNLTSGLMESIFNNVESISKYASLSAAVTAIGSSSKTIVIDTTTTLAANTTIPANISLEVKKGGLIAKASTYTCTINGPFSAGAYQVFSGFAAGDVTFGTTSIQEIHAKWFNSSSVAANACPSGGTIIIDGSYDVGTYGVFPATINAINYRGSTAAETNIQKGSIIINDGADVVDSPVISFGTSSRVDRVNIRDLAIKHEGSTSYAVVFADAPYSTIDNVFIWGNSLGYGGVLYGDENTVAVKGAYLSSMRNSRILNFTDYGVRVNSTGSQFLFDNCNSSSTVNGAHGGYFNNAEGIHIVGGQWGANNTGGISIYFYNIGAVDQISGVIEKVKFENIAAGEYGIVVDGNTNAWMSLIIKDIRANFNISIAGTLVKFGRAKWCKLINPQIDNPTADGTLVEYGENSIRCETICDYNAATAPISVHASATMPTKNVTGLIARTHVANIITATNLFTKLFDGVDQLPSGFTPVHNGVAWNYAILALADDAASSFIPPTAWGKLDLMNDDELTTWGEVIYDTATPSVTALHSGADFNVTTGALTGTTGTDNKLTVSAHSTDGKIYVEARKGTSNITCLMKSLVYGM